MPQQQIPLPGYMSPGYPGRLVWFGDVFGNNNYQVGGYNLTAVSYGMSGFEWWEATGPSNTGNYFLYPIWGNNASSSEQQAAAPKTLLVKAFYAANGVEVANNTNLAAEMWRVNVVGV
jgi:hypothetical protein